MLENRCFHPVIITFDSVYSFIHPDLPLECSWFEFRIRYNCMMILTTFLWFREVFYKPADMDHIVKIYFTDQIRITVPIKEGSVRRTRVDLALNLFFKTWETNTFLMWSFQDILTVSSKLPKMNQLLWNTTLWKKEAFPMKQSRNMYLDEAQFSQWIFSMVVEKKEWTCWNCIALYLCEKEKSLRRIVFILSRNINHICQNSFAFINPFNYLPTSIITPSYKGKKLSFRTKHLYISTILAITKYFNDDQYFTAGW